MRVDQFDYPVIELTQRSGTENILGEYDIEVIIVLQLADASVEIVPVPFVKQIVVL